MDNSSDHASFDEQHGYHRFHQLDESMFPGGNNDFKSDFAVRTLGEERDILNRSPSPPPPSTNSDDWRYHGNRVYTGESFVYAPRPRPGSEEAWGMQPSGTPRGTATEPAFLEEPANSNTGLGPSNRPSQAAATAYIAPTYPPSTPAPAVSSSTAPPAAASTSSSAPDVSGWTRDDFLKLYKWKVLKKKGFAHMAPQFPGRTEATLRATWISRRAEIREIWMEETGEEAQETSEG